jgi:hypothetical protein
LLWPPISPIGDVEEDRLAATLDQYVQPSALESLTSAGPPHTTPWCTWVARGAAAISDGVSS